MIEASDRATYAKNKHLRSRSRSVMEEVERDWIGWIVDESDRIDVLRILAATRRIYARKVVACAAVETPPPNPLPAAARRGNQERDREK